MFKSYVVRQAAVSESLQNLHNSMLFVLAYYKFTCLEDDEVGGTSLCQSIIYHITYEKNYIYILETYYLIYVCRVNYNDRVARGQGVAGGHFI